MSIQKYSVTQKVNLDGNVVTRTCIVEAEKSEVQLLTAMMAGEITAKVEEPDLVSGSDAPVNTANANFVQSISFGYKNASGDYITKRVQSFDRRAMIFKETSGKKDIESALLNVKMVKSEPTLKPTKVDANMTGTYQPSA